MKQLLTMTPRETALARLLDAVPAGPLDVERCATSEALDRVLAEDIVAPHPLPPFPRSTVDGYAVRAADTRDAGETRPVHLRLVGELRMGRPPDVTVGEGEAALIHTGGALPEGADAVVMLEYTQLSSPDEVLVERAVAPGERVIPVGKDVKCGDLVLAAGKRLRPQELGGLMALGVTEVSVARRPRVAVISTGDELVPPTQTPGMNQVRDINTTSVSALLRRHGATPLPQGIVRDDADALYAVAAPALAQADALIITAGSSVSERDITIKVIEHLGEPGVLVHGVSVKPGKPTILALCDGKPVFGLPGNPVSALSTIRLFVSPVLWRLQGGVAPRPGYVKARLAGDVPGVKRREFFAPVRLEEREDGLWAVPVFGESNLIFTLVRGDGIVHVPLGVPALKAGTEVNVELLP
ncbi:MAG: gephyrin-like molybdotransferase Glp [Anaerolineae bacterium]